MSKPHIFSRRSFLALMAAAPAAAAVRASAAGTARAARQIPVGLELYSVREALGKDLEGTVRSVAGLGYECVEFYAPYFSWTPDYAHKVRRELDELKIHCYSTHNDAESFTPDGVAKAAELNNILGTRYVVMADPGEVKGLDGWKRVAETLNRANEKLKTHGLHAGYHNHDAEWTPMDGQKPMEVLAANTDQSVMLQLDVGTCVASGSDPVAWVNSNPGRIRSMHLKDWSPQQKYAVLFGEGVTPWKELLAAAESAGGVQYYLIEQEGSRFSEMETARRCLAAYRKLRA